MNLFSIISDLDSSNSGFSFLVFSPSESLNRESLSSYYFSSSKIGSFYFDSKMTSAIFLLVEVDTVLLTFWMLIFLILGYGSFFACFRFPKIDCLAPTLKKRLKFDFLIFDFCSFLDFTGIKNFIKGRTAL